MPRNSKAKPTGQSRAKTQADEIYNARRRAKRAAARIEREAAKEQLTGRAKAAAESYVQSLREQIAKTYAKGRDSAEAKRAARVLDVQTMGKGTKTAEQRQNVIFERQLNLAGAGMPSTLAKTPATGQAAVKIFYKATQNIWQGLDPKDRNKAIMARLGVTTLKEAYLHVLRHNPEAFRDALGLNFPIMDTDEEEFFEEPGEEGEPPSPPYMALVSNIVE
jgi:hypothetical protein